MKSTGSILVTIWLVIGVALSLLSLTAVCLAVYDWDGNALIAALLVLALSALVLVGACRCIRGRSAGPALLRAGSVLLLIYGLLYWLLAGIEDTGWVYAAVVSFLILLSLATLAGIGKGGRNAT